MVTNLDLAACFSCSREVGPRAFGIGGKKWRFLKNESKDIYLLKCRQEDEESGSKSGKVRQNSTKGCDYDELRSYAILKKYYIIVISFFPFTTS